MSVRIDVDDDGAVRVENGEGRSEVTVRYEGDATTVQVGSVRLVVSRTQAALHVAGKTSTPHRVAL